MKFLILTVALIGFTRPPKTITPANYIQTMKCFPDLKSDGLRVRFTLNDLRDRIDEKYPSLNEKLVSRDIHFTKAKAKRVMRLKPHDTTFEMALEDINAKGEWMKATQADINDHLLNAEITSDEKTYDDTKLNNHKLSYKLVRKDVVELVFRKIEGKEKLYCYVKDEVGPVCVCK